MSLVGPNKDSSWLNTCASCSRLWIDYNLRTPTPLRFRPPSAEAIEHISLVSFKSLLTFNSLNQTQEFYGLVQGRYNLHTATQLQNLKISRGTDPAFASYVKAVGWQSTAWIIFDVETDRCCIMDVAQLSAGTASLMCIEVLSLLNCPSTMGVVIQSGFFLALAPQACAQMVRLLRPEMYSEWIV